MWTTSGERTRGGGRGVTRSVAAALGVCLSLVCGHAVAETHELLWSASLAASDIRAAAIEVTDGNSGPAGILLSVTSHTSGPHIEFRCARTGELLWRHLPGGDPGGAVLAGLLPPRGTWGAECVVAAGRTLLILDDEGWGVASAGFTGLLRSGAVGEESVSVCLGRPGSGFADRLLCLRPAASAPAGVGSTRLESAVLDSAPVGSVSSGQAWEPVWSSALNGPDGSFDNGFSRPVFGDVDGDGQCELLVVERMNELVCRDGAGTERWRVGLGEKSRLKPVGVASADPVVADVTGDTVPDVVVGCFAGAVVAVDGELGEEIARLQFGTEAHEAHVRGRRLPAFLRDALAATGEPIGEMLAVDLDGIGGDELVFGCSDGFVYAVSPRSGRTLWRFEPGRDVYDRPVLEPGDGGRIILWSEECLYVLSAAGEELASMPRGCISAAAVLGWGESGVDVVVTDGPARKVEAWRVAVPK